MRVDTLFDALHRRVGLLHDIVGILDRVEAIQLDTSRPPGCLIINEMAAPPNDEITNRYLTMIRHGLRDAIRRCDRIDDADQRHNSSREEILVAAIVGANLSHGRDPSDNTASNMIDGLRQFVLSWATDQV